MRKTRKIQGFCSLLFCFSITLCVTGLLLSGCAGLSDNISYTDDTGKLQIVTTIFPTYDFARAAAGDLAILRQLLPPGMESHSYEPTPADLLAVQNCDLLICLGGETESWMDVIIDAVEPQCEILRMMDCVELLEEEDLEGMQSTPGHSHEHSHEHEHGIVTELDEHVWTAPANAARITRAIGEVLSQIDRKNQEVYNQQAETYALEWDKLDEDFADWFTQSGKRTLIFGDRFPLRYFMEAYDLTCYAAFPGCGTQTEPSAATIAFLSEKMTTESLRTIYYIEFSNHRVADSIAENTHTQTALFHSCHNISKQDAESGITCLELMRQNLETLKQTS